MVGAKAVVSGETGSVRKDHSAELRDMLAYPNRYSVGMSSLALQILYRMWNARPDVVCERVFWDEQALAAGLATEGMRPVSGGTDTHLALIDIQAMGVTGDIAEARCDAARITLNKNAIPYDPQPPSKGSGIRVGTPAVTTQGMKEDDMAEIASLIGRAIRDTDGSQAAALAEQVGALVARHPAYPRG